MVCVVLLTFLGLSPTLALFSTIATGRPGTQMGAFGGMLSADEIWDIIAYIRDETSKRQETGDRD
jgi:mono/diheme cytochrome c family protein